MEKTLNDDGEGPDSAKRPFRDSAVGEWGLWEIAHLPPWFQVSVADPAPNTSPYHSREVGAAPALKVSGSCLCR
jgi:hypothetical protein